MRNRRTTLLILVATWLPMFSGRADDQTPAPVNPAPQADLAPLQGTWDCISWTLNGMQEQPDNLRVPTSYEGNRFTYRNGTQADRHGLVTLDPSRSPKAMNIWMLDGPNRDQTNRMIYEVDGDTLRVCLVLDPTRDRPTEFTSTLGSHRLLLVYHRRQP